MCKKNGIYVNNKIKLNFKEIEKKAIIGINIMSKFMKLIDIFGDKQRIEIRFQ